MTQAFRCVDRGGAILLYAPPAPGVTIPVPLHELWKDGQLAADGQETRVWAEREAADRLRARPIPPAVIERFKLT